MKDGAPSTTQEKRLTIDISGLKEIATEFDPEGEQLKEVFSLGGHGKPSRRPSDEGKTFPFATCHLGIRMAETEKDRIFDSYQFKILGSAIPMTFLPAFTCFSPFYLAVT